MIPTTETSGKDAAEEWSTPVNGKKTLPSRQNGAEEDRRPKLRSASGYVKA